jgi:hypothetical protein
MKYTEEQRAGFKSSFRRRRNWHFAAVAAFILALFLKETQVGFLAALFAMLGVLVFYLYNWRCPACRKCLGRAMNPKLCAKCGIALQ